MVVGMSRAKFRERALGLSFVERDRLFGELCRLRVLHRPDDLRPFVLALGEAQNDPCRHYLSEAVRRIGRAPPSPCCPTSLSRQDLFISHHPGHTLQVLKDEATLRNLLQAATAPGLPPSVLVIVVAALVATGDRRASMPLRHQLLTGLDNQVRAMAAYGLGRLDAYGAHGDLTLALGRDTDPEVRAAVAAAMARLGGPPQPKTPTAKANAPPPPAAWPAAAPADTTRETSGAP